MVDCRKHNDDVILEKIAPILGTSEDTLTEYGCRREKIRSDLLFGTWFDSVNAEFRFEKCAWRDVDCEPDSGVVADKTIHKGANDSGSFPTIAARAVVVSFYEDALEDLEKICKRHENLALTKIAEGGGWRLCYEGDGMMEFYFGPHNFGFRLAIISTLNTGDQSACK